MEGTDIAETGGAGGGVPLRSVLPVFIHPVELIVAEPGEGEPGPREGRWARPDAESASGWRWTGPDGAAVAAMLKRTKVVEGRRVLDLPVACVSTETIDKCMLGDVSVVERTVRIRVTVRLPPGAGA